MKTQERETNPTFGLNRLTPMAKLPGLAYFCPNLWSSNYEMHALILESLSTFKMLATKGHYIYSPHLLLTGCLTFCFTYSMDPHQKKHHTHTHKHKQTTKKKSTFLTRDQIIECGICRTVS